MDPHACEGREKNLEGDTPEGQVLPPAGVDAGGGARGLEGPRLRHFNFFFLQ